MPFSSCLRGLTLTVLFLCGLTAFPQVTAGPAALVEGTVTNKITGAPVRHAHVRYIKRDVTQPAIATDTDADGRFSFSLEPGSYSFWVERPGFVEQGYGSQTAQGDGTVLTISAGQQVHNINFHLSPLGAIAGHVFDEYGDPVQGVNIQFLKPSFTTGQRQLLPVMSTSSNDRGEYRAFNLRAGQYFLLATLPDPQTLRPQMINVKIKESFAPVYYPGVTDPASASRIALPEGGEIGNVDFHVRKAQAVTVEGHLFNLGTGSRDSRLQVVLAHNDGNVASPMNRITAIVDESTGDFEFQNVPPGSYLAVASQFRNGRSLSGRTAVEVTGNAAPPIVNVTLMPSFDIAGTIELEGAEPQQLANMTVELVNSEGLAFGPQPSAKADKDGRFRLSGVTAGVWDLVLSSLPEGLWMKSANLGGLDISKGEFNVSPGNQAMHIVLSANGVQISGKVSEDGQPHTAVVVLAPTAHELQGLSRMYHSTPAREDGTFLFKGVPPGNYKLFAFEEIEPQSWLDPEFLRPVEQLGEQVSLQEGERATRQLTPIPPQALLPEK